MQGGVYPDDIWNVFVRAYLLKAVQTRSNCHHSKNSNLSNEQLDDFQLARCESNIGGSSTRTRKLHRQLPGAYFKSEGRWEAKRPQAAPSALTLTP